MTVVPGFIDCHNHAGGDVLLYEVLVGNPFEVEFVTIASIIDKLRAKAQQTPPGTWVEGYFFDDTKVNDKRALNVRDLDEVSHDHPVVVRHRGGHTSFYNSKALRDGRRHQGHAQSAGRHLRQGREGRAERPGHRPRARRRSTRSATGPRSRRAQIEQRARDGHRAHLEAVRALRPDQRAPRGRQPAGHAGRARARRAAAPHQLRGERPRRSTR